MIIYSPVPAELIWQGLEEKYELVEHMVNGIPVQLRLTGTREARVERIISTDPQDYLRASCQPGQSIMI